MKIELDHIGIAVTALKSGESFFNHLGLKSDHTETVESEKVKVGMLELGNQCRIELLEATSAESPIAKFLEKRGPGIHHICLRVENIQAMVDQLKAAGVKMINETPKKGAHDRLVAFIHPSATGGVLIELSQPPKAEK